jgi:hypothetical protein
MVTVDLTTLDEESIEKNIRARLPEGWTLECTQDKESLLWAASIHDGDQVLQWKIEDLIPQQVLCHALGWLAVKAVKTKLQWTRRSGEITQERVHELAYRVTSDEGPADLDPGEVSSVYSSSRIGGK